LQCSSASSHWAATAANIHCHGIDLDPGCLAPDIYFAIISASIGTIMMLNGYLLIFKLPFFH